MPTQLLCNTEVNYAQLPGSALPFRVELDLGSSILNPLPGQYQRFCYTVTGLGQPGPTQKDLSHWVLGICDDITESDIIVPSITVVIDGTPQLVVFGQNVELVSPDPTTGCFGLKFNFPLNKEGGVMNVCFDLLTPFTVGPNTVCLKGGTEIAGGLSICGPSCDLPQHCETFTYQTATVCAPVIVTPKAIPGEARTICCGDPVVTPGSQCPSTSRSCYFTVSQKVCIEIPITFGATAITGAPFIQCEDPSGLGCINCN